MRLAVLLCASLLPAGCSPGDTRLPDVAAPSTVPTPAPPPAPPPGVRIIDIGEEVEDALIGSGSHKIYVLRAPADGLLVAQLTWDANQGSLELWLGNVRFIAGPSSPAIVGRLQVSAGETYHLSVFDAPSWEFDDVFVQFVLTAALE